MSLGFTARWEMSEAASYNTSETNDAKRGAIICFWVKNHLLSQEKKDDVAMITTVLDSLSGWEMGTEYDKMRKVSGRGTHIGLFHRFASPDCFPFILPLLLLLMGIHIIVDTSTTNTNLPAHSQQTIAPSTRREANH